MGDVRPLRPIPIELHAVADPEPVDPVAERIVRVDRYTIAIGAVRVVASPTQEALLRAMTDEQLDRFVKIMSGKGMTVSGVVDEESP